LVEWSQKSYFFTDKEGCQLREVSDWLIDCQQISRTKIQINKLIDWRNEENPNIQNIIFQILMTRSLTPTNFGYMTSGKISL